MAINETLSRYSDLSYGTAFVVYLLALILFCAQLASVRTESLKLTVPVG